VLDASALPSGSPANDSATECVELGDLDLDGDWDVVMADGGFSNDQNRIWINQGGLQGGALGVFADDTLARAPAVLDMSRDVELADYDGDGDLDVYVANTSQLVSQASRFWTNLGGEQGGTLGFFVDETHARWVGLGGAGSSISPALVLPGGGFLDWAEDGEFADLDEDGDLDLVHVSAGGAFGGQTPTRLFVNDGAGNFHELNPSGFQIVGATIANGDPALWADGVQQADTLDATGVFSDVAAASRDAELADVDGDFDLDLLLGDRQSPPRMFLNPLKPSPVLSSGNDTFRDFTGQSFVSGYVVGGGNYEQEFGDLDGDGDVDVLGVGWGSPLSPFTDKVLVADGLAHFTQGEILPGLSKSSSDGELFDFDSDGLLDVFLATFDGPSKLIRNIGLLTFTLHALPAAPAALDADSADVDGDGDPDVLLAVQGANALLRNDYDQPDTHAPYVGQTTPVVAIGGGWAFSGTQPLRATVFDNAPAKITRFADVALAVEVGGVALPDFPMRWSGGQVFAGGIPGTLVGGIVYRVRATDEHGNEGLGAPFFFSITNGDTGQPFGHASSGGTTGLASLSQTFAGQAGWLHATAPPGALVWLGASASKLTPGVVVPGLPNLLLNLAPPVVVIASGTADADGDLVVGAPVPPSSAGATLYLQAVSFDGATLESSAGLELLVYP